MAKKCIYCGFGLEDDAMFCNECGRKQEDPELRRREAAVAEMERAAEEKRIREEKELRIRVEAEAKAKAEAEIQERRRQQEREDQLRREDAERRLRIESEARAKIEAEKADERAARQLESMTLQTQLEPMERMAVDALKNNLMSTKNQKKRQKMMAEFQTEIFSESQRIRLSQLREKVGRKEPAYIVVNRVFGWIILVSITVLVFIPSLPEVVIVLLCIPYSLLIIPWIVMKIIQLVARTRADNYLNIKNI